MIIPKDTILTWDNLREHGDFPKLVHLTGLSRSTLYNIFEGSDCPTEAAVLITAFYDERQKQRQSLNTDKA